MSEESIAFDSVLDLCQHHHRRIVLAVLTAERRALTLNDLTQTVLTYTQQTPITAASEDEITQVRLSLYHGHLPKLASEGLIEFDPERQLVEPTTKLEQLQPTLATILDADPTLNRPIEL